MPVVTGTEKDPAGNAHKNSTVRVRLVAALVGAAPGYVPASDYSIEGEFTTRTDNAGVWTATLVANELIAPANTFYLVDMQPKVGQAIRHTISVPNGAGPYRVEDILTDPPANLPTLLSDLLATETAARIAADALLIPLTQRAAANGVATLGADSKIPGSQLPALAIGETFVVASQAAMLALTAQRGDVAVRTDLDPDGFFLLSSDSPATLADWVQITSGGAVLSVDGQTGAVDLSGTYVLAAGNTETVQDIVGGMVTGNTETDIAVTYDDTAGKLNFVVVGGSGVPAITVPYFDNAVSSNIYHGAFWPTGVDLGPFEWESWMRHDTGAEYWISEGFGGAHAILAGFGGGVPTGNVWNGTSSTSFSGAYTAQDGEWLHYRIMWDGTAIWCLINGIVVGSVAFAGPRRAQYGDLFIAGSDHSNWEGAIAQVRAWEGQAPHNPWTAYNNSLTERHFLDRTTSAGVLAQFVSNYLSNTDVFPDLGDGFAGQSHPGAIRGAYNGFGFESLAPHPERVVDATAPFGNQMTVARTRTPAAAVAAPAGARIWDSFGGADTNWAWVLSPTLGSTEGGSLGVMAWAHTAGYWARFDGSAVCGFFYDFARVASNSADMDVRVGRLVDAAKGFYYCSAAARINAARTTGWFAYTTSAATVGLFRPDGSQAGAWTPASTTWTHLRILTAGTTITVYTGTATTGPWTQVGQVTGETANQAEVGAGLYHYFGVGTAARYTDFHVAA